MIKEFLGFALNFLTGFVEENVRLVKYRKYETNTKIYGIVITTTVSSMYLSKKGGVKKLIPDCS